MNLKNHQIRLAARPIGMPKVSDWSYLEEPAREPRDGEMLIKVLYISLDPAMRGWMSDRKSYIPPVPVGDVMRALPTPKIADELQTFEQRSPRSGEILDGFSARNSQERSRTQRGISLLSPPPRSTQKILWHSLSLPNREKLTVS